MEGVTNHTGPKGLFKENPRGFWAMEWLDMTAVLRTNRRVEK